MGTKSGLIIRRLFGLGFTLVLLVGATVVNAVTPAAAAGNHGGVVTRHADPTINFPAEITAGPDGAMWFANSNGNSIERITTAGVITNFTDPTIDVPWGIAAGPDGALWFTNEYGGPDDVGSIGRITTAGVVSNFTDPSIEDPQEIVTGPDGALWFTNPPGNTIGRITTAGVVTNFTSPTISYPFDIASGPDGALWFTNDDPFGRSIGRITTSGVVTNFSGANIIDPVEIAAGADGAMWFTDTSTLAIGRITTAGVVTRFPGLANEPEGIAAGPDGAMWFTMVPGSGSSIGRITTGGVVSTFTAASIQAPLRIAAGPDRALWFTNSTGNSIGRITTRRFAKVWPGSGPVGSGVNVWGAIFTAGETVSASYMTGLSSPASVPVCTATAAADGTFSCNGTVPTTNAGALGSHVISVKGLTSLTTANATFKLTATAARPHISYVSSTVGGQEVITVNGSRFEPFSDDRVDVYDPVAAAFQYGWPTASALGTFTINVAIPAYPCRGNVTIDAIQYAPISAATNVLTDPANCVIFSALNLRNGWTNAPFGTSNAAAGVFNGIVHLKGAIATTGTNPVAFTLPVKFRPATAVYVPIDLCNATKGRLYIQPSGVVTVEAETAFSNAQCFTSLDGASYALTAPTPLILQNGWTNAPFGTSNASAALVSGIVHLKGAIATTGTNTNPFTLPANLRPSTYVYVPIDLCGAANGRLDIAPNGVATVEAESSFASAQCFTSLDGASYALTAPTPLTLQNGWTNAPFGTSNASAALVSGIVHLKGAIATAGTNTVAFTLPANLRPAATVYTAVDLCSATNGRFVIQPSGVVAVEAETTFANAQCFTSLDGVSFAP